MVSTGSKSASPLGLGRVVLASLRYSWRVSLSVALGVATATAVIVGALLVGDSMRGSLRQLTLERLGEIESVVVPGAFFELEDEQWFDGPAQAMVFFSDASVEASDGDEGIRRAARVQVLGIDDRFWELDSTGLRPAKMPRGDEIVLNANLARELDVAVGDLVTIRLPVEQAVPADSPLGRRETQSEGLPRMVVADIVPDEGLGRFSMSPNQTAPQNIYVDREILLDALDRAGQANMLLFDRKVADSELRPGLTQLGLQLERVTETFAEAEGSEPQVIYDYYSLTSERLLLPEPVVERVVDGLPADAVTRAMTYLANAIETLDADGEVVASVPYSIITAMDSSESLPLDYQRPTVSTGTGTGGAAPTDGEAVVAETAAVPLVINDWTAERLSAVVGTPIRVAYYEPEVEKGKEVERYFDAVVTDIVPITEPESPYRRRRPAVFDQPPTVYNDPHLTPSVPGVTDQASISDWDLPFQLTRKIEAADDRYWNNHRLTPKAFLPLADGQRLFGSRFGQTTGMRMRTDVAPSVEALEQQILDHLKPVQSQLGWSAIPIRSQQLAASRGTTPFDALFLSLSFFVILSAVMLIAMLFRLGIASRLREFGTVLALGWTPRHVAKWVLLEGICLALVGVAIGIAGGVGYAWLVLWALRSWWVGAVTVPFLEFYWTPRSLFIGGLASGAVAVATMALTIRAVTRMSAQTLLSGRDESAPTTAESVGRGGNARAGDRWARWGNVAAVALVAVALAVALWGATLSGPSAAGGFVAAGMMLLLAGLLVIYLRFRQPRRLVSSLDASVASRRYTLGVLANRSASKQPLRSTLTIGLMATASFLIIAITAFRLQPDASGTGGFELIAQSSQPIFRDLNDATVRSEWLGPESNRMSNASIASMRLRPGQDASCNNLYQAQQPTVLGIPASVAPQLRGDDGESGFRFAVAAQNEGEMTPWDLLDEAADGSAERPVPVIIDQNTAMWSLGMKGKAGETRAFDYGGPAPFHFRVVGLLSNSILQGKLMIGEANFEQLFPDISGYQYFLIRSEAASADEVAKVLENRLGDVGMDVVDANEVLARLLAVQNTYLRTFQSLGGLGLLLGTIGLAIAQLRGVLERRGELAIMRAVGFTRRRLGTLVLSETLMLLLVGIGCGAGAAVLAVLPYAMLSGLQPPIAEPLGMLLGITLFGLLAAVLSLRRVMRLPLLPALRGR